jgi:hypothetical protein
LALFTRISANNIINVEDTKISSSSAIGKAACVDEFATARRKMIYMGHFSFDEFGSEKEIRHGYFTCVVEKDSAEAAANEFKELIFSLKRMDDIFGNIATVYMEDIIEIRDIPRKAIVTRIQSSAGEFPKSVSKSLPHVVTPGINVYGWAPDVEENETERSTEEYKPTKPFIQF